MHLETIKVVLDVSHTWQWSRPFLGGPEYMNNTIAKSTVNWR